MLKFEQLFISAAGRLHFAVVSSTFLPIILLTLQAAQNETYVAQSESFIVPSFFLSLLIILPAAAIYFVQKRVETLTLFLLYSSAIFLIGVGLICLVFSFAHIGPFVAVTIVNVVSTLLFLADAIHMRYNNNDRIRAKRERDPTFRGNSYFLPLPSLYGLIWFSIVYIVSLFAHSKGLGNVALAGAVIYFFVTFPYMVMRGRSEYLDSLRHVTSVPYVRISSLSIKAIIRVLMPCAVFAFVAIMTASERNFLDIPKLSLDLSVEEEAGDGSYLEEISLMQEQMLQISHDNSVSSKYLATLFDFILNLMAVSLAILATHFLFLVLRRAFIKFRRQKDDEEECPAMIQGIDEHIKLNRTRRRVHFLTASDRIRRRYRRTILHYRTRRPRIWETPSEIEKFSCLPDTEQMLRLHQEYEYVRYSGKTL